RMRRLLATERLQLPGQVAGPLAGAQDLQHVGTQRVGRLEPREQPLPVSGDGAEQLGEFVGDPGREPSGRLQTDGLPQLLFEPALLGNVPAAALDPLRLTVAQHQMRADLDRNPRAAATLEVDLVARPVTPAPQLGAHRPADDLAVVLEGDELLPRATDDLAHL